MPADSAVLSPRVLPRQREPVPGGPGPAVRGAVAGYRGLGPPAPEPALPCTRLPTGLVRLVIGFGPPLPEEGGNAPAPLVSGVRTRSAVYEGTGPATGIEVALTPMAAYSLLGLPMHQLADRCVELGGADLPGAGRLAAALGRLSCWSDRCAALDRFLAERIAAGPPAAPGVALAVRAVQRSAGRGSVAGLAAEIRHSRRHLERLFREQVGVTPKTYAQVVRFRHALRLLAAGIPPADAAARAGFHDQAHLHREFRSMSGRTPRQFLCAPPPDALGWTEAAFLQSPGPQGSTEWIPAGRP